MAKYSRLGGQRALGRIDEVEDRRIAGSAGLGTPLGAVLPNPLEAS